VTTAVPAEVDLFVIGAGSGGVRAARIAAGYGAKVAVAEEYRVGGTCVIRGCVPKKLLVYASRFGHEFEDAAGFGWTVPEPTFDWATLIANKDKEIDRLERAYVSNLEKPGVQIVRSRAVIADPQTIRLASGETVRAKHILIATGGTPVVGELMGREHVITSNEAFHLKKLPPRVLIQGGGYIAVEFAAIFAGLGSEVIQVYRGGNILRGFDDDVRTHLHAEMERRGIKIITNDTVMAVRHSGDAYEVDLAHGGCFDVDCVMFATGRKPNVAGIGLEKIGVKLAPNGGIAVDEFSRTSVPHIYAVGDVTNRINLTPVAIREGHAFADSVFGGKPTKVDHADVATAVFSEPEVGVVGITETEAREKYPRVDIYKATFRPMKATLSGRDTRMLMKLVVDGDSDRVLGCHIVGEAAAEMIQMAAIAVKMKATKADFDATMALHPTAAEELVTMRTPSARYGLKAAE
jgi:glutathione reductase (NADPH)